jgi:hypothetical protein
LDFVVGYSEDLVACEVRASAQNDTGGIVLVTGIGLDVTNALTAGQLSGPQIVGAAGSVFTVAASMKCYPGVGKHYLAWLEYVTAVGTTTWYGDGYGTGQQAGIHGTIMG